LNVRSSLAILIVLVCASAPLAACSDDHAPSSETPSYSPSGERLSDEAYFKALVNLQSDLKQHAEGRLSEDESAREQFDANRDNIKYYGDQLAGINPPEDLADKHKALADTLGALLVAYDNYGGDIEKGFFQSDAFLNSDVYAGHVTLNNVLCALQDLANGKRIQASLDCNRDIGR
jgi:hypothetical protein